MVDRAKTREEFIESIGGPDVFRCRCYSMFTTKNLLYPGPGDSRPRADFENNNALRSFMHIYWQVFAEAIDRGPEYESSAARLVYSQLSYVSRLDKTYPRMQGDLLKVYPWPRSVEDQPNMVSFYPSFEDVLRGRRIITRIGRYLTRMFPKLKPEEVAILSEEWTREMRPPVLKWACTRDEIRHVYMNGPHSCMAGNQETECHPAEVYAGPDTMVAYLETDDGRITARAVVITGGREDPTTWKFYSGYGNYAALRELLLKEGVKETERYQKGVRLLLITEPGGTVCPYIDFTCSVSIEGEYLVTGGGEYDLGDMEGCYLEAESIRCEDCGDRTAVDDIISIEWTGAYVCYSCLDQHYVEAYVGRWKDYVPVSEDVYEYAGEYYTQEGLEHHDLELLDDGEVHHIDSIVETGYGERIHIDYAVRYEEDDTWWAEDDMMEDTYGKSHPKAYMSQASDGEFVLTEELEEYESQLTLEFTDADRTFNDTRIAI